MIKRSAIYLAADWEHDFDAVSQIRRWNEEPRWSLQFRDIHNEAQARDTSLRCSIKRSLSNRMKQCRVFVLIVGEKTKKVTSGACYYCNRYLRQGKGIPVCTTSTRLDINNESYIAYECRVAIENRLRIIVFYKSTKIEPQWCPDVLRGVGEHLPMKYEHDSYFNAGKYEGWDYNMVKYMIENFVK